MDAERKLIARKMFRLRVYEAKGMEYQRLFEKVMQYRYAGFVPIKPHGRIGDQKNDGYVPATGTYFQVYAPENPTTAAPIAARKAEADFSGLIAHWHERTPIRTFRLVFNDNYRGSSPQVEAAMAKIQRDHSIDARVFLARDLEDEALQLADDELIDVINTPIPPLGLLPSIDFSILREVVKHVFDQKIQVTADSVLQAPLFDDKIRFNGLSHRVASLLTVGSYQSEAVTDFFSKNSTFARQALRDQLAGMYAESRAHLRSLVASSDDLGDMIFFDLLNRITPTGPAQGAAMVVMAFYFEACDIFEDPNATT